MLSSSSLRQIPCSSEIKHAVIHSESKGGTRQEPHSDSRGTHEAGGVHWLLTLPVGNLSKLLPFPEEKP